MFSKLLGLFYIVASFLCAGGFKSDTSLPQAKSQEEALTLDLSIHSTPVFSEARADHNDTL